MKLALVFIGLQIFGGAALAQHHKFIGRVLDAETQRPIKNANINIQGTSSGTISNVLGFFELTVDTAEFKTLIASHVGFKTAQIPIPSEQRFKFLLEKEYVVMRPLNLARYPRNDGNDVVKPKAKAIDPGNSIVVESGAEYPDGMDKFYDFVGNSLAPELANASVTEFTISFTINEVGQPIVVTVSDSLSQINTSVILTFEKMPTWTPGLQGQNPVPESFVLPVSMRDIPDVKSLGLDEFNNFVSYNMIYPAQARRMGVEGAVLAEFQLDDTGNITQIVILKDIGAGCGDEVVRLLSVIPVEMTKSLAAKTQYSRFILPVLFGLQRPFKGKPMTVNSDALMLQEILVTAISIQRTQAR